MAIWGVLSTIGAGTWAVHGLNVLLHGANACLATLVVGQWVTRRSSQLLTGVFVLVSPIAVEPVVWGSGFFDVLSTTFLLLALLLAGRSSLGTPPPRTPGVLRLPVSQRAAVLALALAAFATKESAIVLPVLLGVHLWAIRVARPFAPRLDWLITAVLAGLYAAFRIVWAAEAGPLPGLDWSGVLRATFSAFGSFTVPWRMAELDGSGLPWLAIAFVIVLVTLGFAWLDRATVRAPLAGLLWVLVAIVPVAPFLAVGPDLEGSRYVYLASIGWAAMFSSLAEAASSRAWAGARLAALSLVAAIYVVGVRAHITPWVRAGELRDAVLDAAAGSAAVSRCDAVSVLGLPDTMDGAEVFRNTAVNMFASRGVHLVLAASPDCSFSWDQTSGSLRGGRP
jgi:hypothetical protein